MAMVGEPYSGRLARNDWDNIISREVLQKRVEKMAESTHGRLHHWSIITHKDGTVHLAALVKVYMGAALLVVEEELF